MPRIAVPLNGASTLFFMVSRLDNDSDRPLAACMAYRAIPENHLSGFSPTETNSYGYTIKCTPIPLLKDYETRMIPLTFSRPPESPRPGILSTPQSSHAKCGGRLKISANTAFACARTTLVNAEFFIRPYSVWTFTKSLLPLSLEPEILRLLANTTNTLEGRINRIADLCMVIVGRLLGPLVLPGHLNLATEPVNLRVESRLLMRPAGGCSLRPINRSVAGIRRNGQQAAAVFADSGL
ncbi:uncharacterized protein BO96DRAFT_440076 [Aspergillus niger CBS 101883]|uniref:Contig An11c0050, genomic contig n=2 Tax=Aspergillus niger TaxID=5061 RepID=A2QVF6_ASPNC|nr:uncharacterized protein BO96DRAFT_440076 [Aspergillus niger CBS 101883]XP_059604254.1 uncharacterized protein An11g01230 [Aspergillus niger]PYH50270.1 hypothetical protein BO96DRAFT_440076 [Aspergillus niger CBS 101883]CAK45860.1 unnamed protein product [Aspergillus niger]